MAPQLLSGKAKVTEKIDVYSFGIVMWELLTGDEPYPDMHCASIIGGSIDASEAEDSDSTTTFIFTSCMSNDLSFLAFRVQGSIARLALEDSDSISVAFTFSSAAPTGDTPKLIPRS